MNTGRLQPISTRLPGVKVEYDGEGGVRLTKQFEDAYKARSFYGTKLKQGKNPKVLKLS